MRERAAVWMVWRGVREVVDGLGDVVDHDDALWDDHRDSWGG